MSEEISSIPEGIDTRKELNTTKDIKPAMPQPRISKTQLVRDIVKLELLKPVGARMRNRYKQIKEMSMAITDTHTKGSQKIHKTYPPQMHIADLKMLTKNGIGTITYQRYKTDDKGNKLYVEQYGTKRNDEGEMIIDKSRPPVGGSYKTDCLVVETLAYGKAMTVEEIKEFAD